MKKIASILIFTAFLLAILASCQSGPKKDRSGFTAEEHLAFGNSWFESMDYMKAEHSYRKAIELNPKYGDAYVQLGLLFYILYEKELIGDRIPETVSQYYNQAYNAYEQGIKYSSKNPRAYTGFARLHMIGQKYDEAVNNLLKAREIAKLDDFEIQKLIHSELGICYLAQEKFSKALEEYNGYLELTFPNTAEHQQIAGIIKEIEKQISER